MQTQNQISLARKTLYGIAFLGLFFSAFGAGNLRSARAQEEAPETPTAEVQVQKTATPVPEIPVQATITPTSNGQTQATATPTSEVEAQIVGGTLADPGEYPWQVALVSGNAVGEFYSNQFCGGSLINPQWVLTAAHCITEDNGSQTLPATVDVVAGIWDLASPVNGYQQRDVIHIIRHPAYNSATYDNDIALLQLASPITIGGSGATKTAIIPLVPANVGSLTSANSWVSGWGNTSSSSSDYPYQLREVQLPIIDNSICNNASHYYGGITSNMLCAGYDAGGKDSCQGDSGGPIVVSNAGQWNLAGIVSWGDGCAQPYKQGVYTRVSQYVNWVKYYIEPSMAVQRIGSGIPIPNGDTTPSLSEGTDLGGVGIDKARLFEFKILNSNNVLLQLTGNPIVVISGDPSFTVSYQPELSIVGEAIFWGNSFKVRFSPNSVGLHTATVSIANSTTDKNPYTFTIQGLGGQIDAYENDNNFLTAKTITPGTPQNHSIFPMGDHDYVKFTLASPSSVVLETSGANGYDTELALYDANHNLIGYDNDSGNFLYSRLERTCSNSLPAGTYYLMTYIYQGIIPEYQLDFSSKNCAATLTSPSGSIGNNYNPGYTWNKVEGATWYRLYASGSSGLVTDGWYESSSICAATTCSATPGPSATLTGGNYTGFVQTYFPTGYGPWGLPTTFSTTLPTAPVAAVLTAPKNSIGTDYNPNYTWDKVASATYYHLYVAGPSGVVLDQWYPAASICPAVTCSVPSPVLAGGNYAWYVQTYNPVGYGPWSNNTQPTNFSTTVPSAPAPAVLTAPKNNIATNYNPTYTWGRVATATYYHLYVAGPGGVALDQWYQASIICDTTTCSVASPTLGGGAYVWYVQTYNAAGYGPWSNNAQPTNFNTSTTPPVAAVLTAPTTNIGTDYNPTYTWGKVAAATWYHLYVAGPGGVVLDQWYSTSICDAITCSVASPTLGGGAHVWYVQTYGPAGYGPWSNNSQPTNFNTTMPSAPAAAVLTAPKNAIGTDYNPTYTWNKVVSASYYHLYVAGPGGVVLDQWYPASGICNTTTCSVISPILGGGAHVWYVQTYNAAGYGPWSNNAQPTNFNTTTLSAPVGATLTAPSGTTSLHTPTYTWDRVSMATWYHLYVKGPSGVVKDQWYQASSVCNTTTCSIASPALESGFHTWWVQTYNSAGYGPWKSTTFTVSP